MRSAHALVTGLVPVLACSALVTGARVSRAQETGAKARLASDPRITTAFQQISADQIRQTIEKLVSFGNRSTISPQDDESLRTGKGIGAAREWIKSELERYSKDCGGCLQVKTDTFTEQPTDRIPKPTVLTNVYAILPGTDPRQADRIMLVTGHYDSRNTDP